MNFWLDPYTGQAFVIGLDWALQPDTAVVIDWGADKDVAELERMYKLDSGDSR